MSRGEVGRTLGRMQIKRIYEPVADDDGYRVLMDRLWPRGVTKERAALDEWRKELAPSNDLRKAFHADMDFDEFAEKYDAELAASPAVASFLDEVRRHDQVTLVYAAHDPDQNHAVVLLRHLEARLAPKPRRRRARADAG